MRIPLISPDGQTPPLRVAGDQGTAAATQQHSAVMATTPVRASEAAAGQIGLPVRVAGGAPVVAVAGAVDVLAAVVSGDSFMLALEGVVRYCNAG